MPRIKLSPELGGWIALLCSVPFLLAIPVPNDSAWQMWLGRQMLHGANLYTDLVEVNPPLWFWMAVPMAWVAEMLALPSRIVLVGFLLLTIALSYGLCMPLIRDWPARKRVAFVLGFLLATIPISLRIFTQREHFVLVATIPYILLCGARDQGQKVSQWLAISIGAVAATGFAIKPFFALVPIALELWLWRKARRLRPETLCLGGLAAAYIAVVILVERDFVAATPVLAAAYPYFTAGHQTGFAIPFLLFTLALVPLSTGSATSQPFSVAALAFLLTFILQSKAWSYQALPAMGTLALALTLSEIGKSAVRDAFGLGILATAVGLNARQYPADHTYSFPSGSAVATLSVSSRPDWPQAEERGYIFPLHTISLWQLPAIEEQVLPATPLQDRIARDLRCNPPLYLVVDQEPMVRKFLSGSSALKSVLSHYRPIVEKDRLTLYQRSGSFASGPMHCRKIFPARAS